MPISGSATTNRTSAAIGAQTCRLPSILSALGHRQVGYLAFGSRPVGSPANCRWGADRSAVWRSGADLSAPQHIGVGGPTGRFPRKLPLGARHVGSPDTAFTLVIPNARTRIHEIAFIIAHRRVEIRTRASINEATYYYKIITQCSYIPCLVVMRHDNRNRFKTSPPPALGQNRAVKVTAMCPPKQENM